MHSSGGLAIFTSFGGLGVLCVNPITAETLYVLPSWLKGELWKVLKVVGIDNGEIVVLCSVGCALKSGSHGGYIVWMWLKPSA